MINFKDSNPNDPSMVATGAYGSAFELALNATTNSDGTTTDTPIKATMANTNGSSSATSTVGSAVRAEFTAPATNNINAVLIKFIGSSPNYRHALATSLSSLAMISALAAILEYELKADKESRAPSPPA